MNPDCYFGDHNWRGTGACGCGARLRCACGAFITESGVPAHLVHCVNSPPEDAPDDEVIITLKTTRAEAQAFVDSWRGYDAPDCHRQHPVLAQLIGATRWALA